MAVPWVKREPVTVLEGAAQMAALFAQECRRTGDTLNFYRWRMVLNDLRRMMPDPRQMSFVAE